MPDELFALQDQYVVLAGEVISAVVEYDPDPRKVDHVWIDVRAGGFGRLQIALSTSSRQNRLGGFDSRVRMAVVQSSWLELPRAGVRPVAGLDYGVIDADHHPKYFPYERVALEEVIVAKAGRAVFVEAWGEFYARAHIGVHQVHSRRASFGVPRDVIGRDGAIRFYFAEPQVSEMLLFKFAGQP